MRWRKLKLMILGEYCLFFSIVFYASLSFSHAEEIQVKSDAKGPVHLEAKQAQSLDLRVIKVGYQPLSETLILNGEIQLLPDRQANVSTRINGQVTAIYTELGKTVRINQALAKVQSRLVGDPPPSVNVVAPIGGVVDAQNVNIGSSVDPNIVLFHISDRSQVILLAHVYEEDLNKIKMGQNVNVYILSYSRQLFPGKIYLIDPNLDPTTRTVKVWIILNNSQGLLKPNMFGRAHVILRKMQNTLAIPHSAIIEANGEKFVFMKKGDNYHRVVINTGAMDDHYAEVKMGLHLGDEIVSQGNRQLYTLWLTGGSVKSGNNHV